MGRKGKGGDRGRESRGRKGRKGGEGRKGEEEKREGKRGRIASWLLKNRSPCATRPVSLSNTKPTYTHRLGTANSL